MDESFTCILCLDVFEKPVIIDCGNQHRFCKECLENHMNEGRRECPICRQSFNTCVPDENMAYLITHTFTQCPACHLTVQCSLMRKHVSSCEKMQAQQHYNLTKHIFKHQISAPNRHTFKCPYCQLSHLDHASLITHCNSTHLHETLPVVCPICASMPWGDPHQKSCNFISHLNLRHQFEYHTYVNFEENDEKMMEAALKASLLQQ